MANGFTINLHDRLGDGALWKSADNLVVEDNVIYVSGHGTPHYISDDRKGKDTENVVKLSALDLAKMIVDEGARQGLDENTVQNMKVILGSCSTGQGQQSFARELSHYFSEVVAPTRVIWSGNVDSSNQFQFAEIYGKTSVPTRQGSSLHDGIEHGKPDHGDPGRMKAFYPTDYMYCKDHPECDTLQSERPFSTQPVYDPKSGKHLDGRDAANDHLILSLDSPYALSPRIAVSEALQARAKHTEYRQDMVNAYLEAVNQNTSKAWVEAMSQYPLLAPAYNFRTEMLHRAADSGVDQAQYGKAIDKHIIEMISNGHVRELNPPPVSQQTEQQLN